MDIRILLAFALFFVPYCFAEPISADKLFDDPDVQQVRLSPDGKFVSAYVLDDENYYFSLIDTEKMKTTRSIPMGKDNRIDSYYWLNNTDILLNIDHRNKDRVALIFRLIKDNQVQALPIKTHGYFVHDYPKDSSKVLFAKHSRNRKYTNLFLIDIDNLANDDFSDALEIEHDKSTNYYSYDPNFNIITTFEYDEDDDKRTFSYLPWGSDEWITYLTITDKDYELKFSGFINQSKIAILTNKETDKVVLREYDIYSKEFSDIVYQHPEYDLDSAHYNEKGELIGVSYLKNGLRQWNYFDPSTKKAASRIANTFKNAETYFIDTTHDKSSGILHVNGSDQPGEYFLIDDKATTAQRLLVSYQTLDDEYLHPSETFYLTSKDGSKIEAFITYPSSDFDFKTLLVMPHGGPIGVSESDRFNAEVQYFASRGFAVLRVNFRGSSGFGKAFQDQGVGQFGKLIEEDITLAVNTILKKKSFKHICSIGASYGGYSAVMLAMKHPSVYKCVIGGFGVYDLQLLYNVSNHRSGGEFTESVEKIAGKYREELKEVSPVHQYRKLKAPILLIAGKDDDIADFEHTNRFKYLLKKTNHDVETLFFENTGHGHSSNHARQIEAAVTFDYLRRVLNLKLPTKNKLSNSGREAIARDFALIADRYEFDNNTDIDKEKAFDYYKLAAKYDHPRSLFNLGATYHSGDDVKKDLAKAIDYYKAAADLEYENAHKRLGRMYMEGEYVKQNWSKAKHHLEKATQLDPSPDNNIMLARFYCSAPKPHKDIHTCLKLMQLEQYDRISERQRKIAVDHIKSAMPWILAESQLTQSELESIKRFAKSVFELSDYKVYLENIKLGSFAFKERESFGERDTMELVEAGTHIQALPEDKDRFGVQFEVDAPGLNTSKDRVAIPARWIKIDADGQTSYPRQFTLWGSPDGTWSAFLPFKEDTTQSKWKLQLFNWEQQVILEREFIIN
ncbi:prolyl oligopeptidase family serine peptidase [Pleionea sediminis]|uniref:prolyl oligopeptidase family serine peptidase n=1 Tax=Pleionea sediminis TaxID=2569479 RepID=UPI001185F0D3|nr:prolyl oligopeptidase family serine peptidase [Pleionea sediminis]